jgi:ParB-like chromosome segregation protein Spo0J
MAQAAEKASQKRMIHPAANLFPMMTDEEYQALREDIKTHGQLEPIIYWKNMLVDGRNRLKACEELNIEPKEVELMDETDPVAYVLSYNLHRRHLTTSQRAMVSANVANLKHGGDRKSEQESNCTLEESAKLLNVSVDSVKRAKKVKDKGTPELAEMVSSGKVSVDAASKVATKPKAEQEAIVAKGPAAVKEAAACVPKKVAKGAGVKPGSVGRTEYKHVASTNSQYAGMAILQLERIDFSQDCAASALDGVELWIAKQRGTLKPALQQFKELWEVSTQDAKAAIFEWIREHGGVA